ncbi:hypothetical protein N7462_009206 [Penicillium macrosclerotiorum]|uniref:uncharacterized protein n=1 Tax=Penicillium macrosclerotiorum TaxID=303699 RepID=UPI0025493E3A|nr:uncharacterized protein N7462_009206 [Penicillium macrosclerotiorum]KAJ5673767.1 hypothetical protein N7462_009206 [Penicillium macrosclerotiorum]
MGLRLSPRLCRSLGLCLLFAAVHATITVEPSNNTQDLAWSSSATFRFHGASPLSGQTLAPLTQYLVNLSTSQVQGFDVAGTILEVTATNSQDLSSSQIACIPCDSSDYPGELDASQTVQSVISAESPPAAIVLFSASENHCNLTRDASAENFRYIFTLKQAHAAAVLNQTLSTTSNKTYSIVPMSYPVTTTTADTSSDTGGSGDSPNTAMIILYSITGIITALFLGIIITGAVRAHRHPERYGPRRVAGRPRQSRARGIAQAMLDTIPVVKFGDNADGVDAAKRDVEMAGAEDPAREHSPSRSDTIADVEQTTPHESEMPTSEQPAEQSTDAAHTHDPKPEAAPDGGNFSCPICTDDFIKGQDLRVLPCSHQFHPECIDPWLVNVSGTCPLCRIDLNPPKAEENAEQEGEHPESHAEDTSAAAADAPQHRHSHRLTNYLHGPLNARRMRNATVEERLDALRRVREANNGEADDADPARSGRSRLSRRLRERFRIRTRAHGIDSPSPVESGSTTPAVTTPAVPAPAHTTGPSASESNP